MIALQFRYTFYRPQTKRLRARKIGLQYKIRPFFYSALRASGDGLRSPFERGAVRQRGYGLRLLIFKSRSGSDKKRRIVYSRFITVYKDPIGLTNCAKQKV